MVLSNFHTHTVLCDGKSTAQEHIDAALALGFRSLGFSGHGYVPYEGLYCGMTPDDMRKYRDTVDGLKARYAGRLDIYVGLENDSVNMFPADGYDYTIGSVHCILRGGRYYSVDSYKSITAQAVADEFGGDGLAYAAAYYDAVLEFASVKRADILGHIDLVRRFNTAGGAGGGGGGGSSDSGGGSSGGGSSSGGGGSSVGSGGGRFRFFDDTAPEYRRAALAALERAVRSGYIIELNTSPILKGISDENYPANFLLEAARDMGARIMVNSDAHFADKLNYAFDKAEALLQRLGFRERWELAPSGFEPVEI